MEDRVFVRVLWVRVAAGLVSLFGAAGLLGWVTAIDVGALLTATALVGTLAGLVGGAVLFFSAFREEPARGRLAPNARLARRQAHFEDAALSRAFR